MTTPFIPLGVPKDTTGRTPKMLAGIRGRDVTDGPEEPSDQRATSRWEHQFFAEFGQTARLGTPAAGVDEEVECASYIFDNRAGGYAYMQSHVLVAGEPGSKLVVKYSPTLSPVSWADFASLSIQVADPVVPRTSVPLLVPDASRVEQCLLRLFRRGAASAISPEMWNVIIGMSTTKDIVPPGSSGLPEDAIWGSVIWDLNAEAPIMKANYSDGADVNNFFDSSPNGFNATSSATLLLPTYNLTGFGPNNRACVEWAGANVLLQATNANAGIPSWTFYVVMEGLDGGDLSFILDGNIGYPFGFSMTADADEVGGHVNSNAFENTEDYGVISPMGDPHIFRFVKDGPGAHWHMALNGIRFADNFANPQGCTSATLKVMDKLSGLGMSGKVGRIVEYNKAHMTSTGGSPWVNGLTAPENVLRTFYGTT